MNIIVPALKFNRQLTYLNKNAIDSIAIHHIKAFTATVEDIHSWHLDNGWAGIGYSFYVRKDGTVYKGRGFCQNAAVDKQNGHIISIAFEGDYGIEKDMPDPQFNAGIELIHYIKTEIPGITNVEGHKHWNLTECPGPYFPLEEMKKGLKREVPIMEEPKKEQHWAEKYYTFLIENGMVIHEKRFDDNITRGEVFALLARLKGFKE